MKKIIIYLLPLYLLTLLPFYLSAQPWNLLLPSNKIAEELTLTDYQTAFYKYWEPFNVDKGFINEEGKKIKAGGWKQFKRWEYNMETQVDADGKFPSASAFDIVQQHKKDFPNVYANTPKSANWSILGPFTSGGGYAGLGRLNCIAFHPTNSNVYWTGAAAGGIWATTNNGASWTCLSNNTGVLAVSDIIIPTNYATTNTIYIGTGDRDATDNRSIGVLKSTDGGTTWNTTGLTFVLSQNKMVNRMLLDPNNNNTILVATTDGVYKTTDGGTNWDNQLTNHNFKDMEFKPGNFATLYGSKGNGVWLSTDAGANWTQTGTFNGGQRCEIAVSAADPTVVYALVSNSSSALLGIYKSTNSGGSFTQVFSGSTSNLLGWSAFGDGNTGQGWYDLCIAASPTNANIVLVGGVNTWRSTNGGTSWECVNHWWGENGVQAVHADKHALAYRSDGVLFEGNDGGIYVSTNNGTYWTDKTNGMHISQMYKLSCSETVANEVITGLQDNGSKLFSGNNWYDVKGGDGMECLIDWGNVNIQYGTYVNGQIDRTTDHWNNRVAIEPSGAGDGAWVTPYVIDPKNPAILYAGYRDLWKTTNRGNSWTKISSVSTSNLIRDIAICQANPKVIYIMDQTRIWKTTDGGLNWTRIASTSIGQYTSIEVKNDNPNVVWATRGGYSGVRVYKTINGGETWFDNSAGLPQIPMYSLAYNRLEGQAEQLYVGTEVGVYYKNGENDWVAFNTGIPNVRVGEIEIYYNVQNPQNSRLRAATYGRGLWESPIFIQTSPTAGTITGTSDVCQDQVAQLFLLDFVGAVQWQKSSNGTSNWTDIVNANTSYFTSDLLQDHTYFRARITLGTMVYSDPFYVALHLKPDDVYITKVGDNLVSNYDNGNQWFNQDGLIPGAVNKTYTPTENGSYFVIVKEEPCESEPSNTIVISHLTIGGNAVKDGKFSFFPNPVTNQLTISHQEILINNISIIDMLGREVIRIAEVNNSKAIIPFDKLTAGLYQVRIETEKGVFTSKTVKQ